MATVAVATPSQRRVLRTKLLCFYAKYEPEKSIKDINDLCDWAIANSVDAFNVKLQNKYKDDLKSIKPTSIAELPLITQLRLFYGEFDPSRPMTEIHKVEQWTGIHGIVALNERMLDRYSENLNSLCFGGRDHLLDLLTAFYKRHDSARANPAHMLTIRDWTLYYGAIQLNEKLLHKYGDILHLTIEDIEKSIVQKSAITKEGEADIEWADELANKPQASANRLSVKSGMTSSHIGGKSSPATSTTTPPATPPPVDLAHLQRLVELFYARHAPQKLVEDIVDRLVNWTKTHGVVELNKRLRLTYNADLEDLEKDYFDIYDELEAFYKAHDPKKLEVGGGLDDVVAWGVVHGIQPLSERLKAKYGAGLDTKDAVDVSKLRDELKAFYAVLEPKKSKEDIETIISWVLSNSREALCLKMKEKFGVDLDDYKTKPLPTILKSGSISAATTNSGTEQINDESVIISNELPAALGGTVSRMSNLGIKPIKVSVEHASHAASASSDDQALTKKTQTSIVSASVSSSHSTVSDSSGEEKQDEIEQEMGRMQQIISGKFSHLGLRLEAFYKKHDPSKLNNKEALDLIIKWALKHGVEALNEKLKEKWGEDLNSVSAGEILPAQPPKEPVF